MLQARLGVTALDGRAGSIVLVDVVDGRRRCRPAESFRLAAWCEAASVTDVFVVDVVVFETAGPRR